MATVLSVVSLLVVAITLIINSVQARELVKQTKMLSATNKAVLAESINVAMTELSKILIDNPELRPYIYGSRKLPADDPLRSRVLVMAEMLVDLMWHVVHSQIFFEDAERAGWVNYFRDLAAGSDAIQRYWMARRHWYEPPVWELINQTVEDAIATKRHRPGTTGVPAGTLEATPLASGPPTQAAG